MRIGIATKIILLCFGLVLMASGLLGGIGLYRNSNILLSSKLQETEGEINLLGAIVNSRIDELKNDVLFLSSTPPIEGIIRSNSNKGVDPRDGSTNKRWKERLSKIFEEIILSKENYHQIRFIGTSDKGRELVRVERKNGKILHTKKADLQFKAGSSYFKEALQLGAHEVYLSEITVNKDFGKVVKPVRLMLRAVVPIFIDRKNPFGIIVINLSFTKILDELRKRSDENSSYFVTNKKGVLLFHSDKQFDLGYDRGKEVLASNIFPLTKGFFKGKRTLKSLGVDDNSNEIITGMKLHHNEIRQDDFIGIFKATQRDVLLSKVKEGVYNYLLIIFSIIIVSMILAFNFSRYLTETLKKLTRFIEDFTSKEEIQNIKVDVTSNDEIGVLAKTLNEMSEQIINKDSKLKLQNQALDNSAIVAETDPNGVITYVNDKFCMISGYAREELIGKDHRILNSGHHSKDFIKEIWLHILSGQIWRGEIKNKAKNGEFYWVDTTICPSTNSNGQIEKFIAIRFDVTSRKKAEAELQSAINMAERTAKFKSDFLANMSHEIRTPISGIIGMNNFLGESELDEKQREYVENIKESTNTLLVVINDILDFSKVEAGKMVLENQSYTLKEQLDQVMFMLREKAEEKNIKLDFDLPAEIPKVIKGDSVRLKQILINLINNAIKFTEKGSVLVTVSNSIINEKEIKLKFKVKDTGIGIPPDKLGEVFESFSQAESSTTRKFGGTGLGLSICKNLVELMMGSIWVESEYGKGSEFCFTIQAELGLTADLEEKISNQKITKDVILATEHPLEILIAEDNLVNQKIISTILKHFGYQVTIVENGLLALEASMKKHYDVIFMDIQMPKMDGVEATTKIQSHYKKIKVAAPWIIALTANVFKEDKKKYFETGFDDFLPKPVDRNMVYTVLKNSFSKESVLKKEFQKVSTDSVSLVRSTGIEGEAVLDTVQLAKLFELGADTQIEVIKTFLENLPNNLKIIKSAIDEENSKEVEISSHALKGEAGYVGAAQFWRQCQKLESLADRGEKKQFAGHFSQLETSSLALEEALSQYLADLELKSA